MLISILVSGLRCSLLGLVTTMLIGCSPSGSEPNQSNSSLPDSGQPVSELTDKEKEFAIYRSDSEANQKLGAISAEMALTKRISSHDFRELVGLQNRYSRIDNVRNLLATALMIRHDWEGLSELYRKQPTGSIDPQQMASALMRAHHYEEAASLLNSENGHKIAEPERKWLLAYCNFHKGDMDGARTTLDQLTSTATGQRLLDVLTLRGLVAIQAGELDVARSNLERAVELRSDHVPALLNLARVLKMTGQLEQAAAMDRKAFAARQAITDTSTIELKMTALAAALDEAWSTQDFSRTKQVVDEMLPHADENLQKTLRQYLTEIEKRSPANSSKSGSGK